MTRRWCVAAGLWMTAQAAFGAAEPNWAQVVAREPNPERLVRITLDAALGVLRNKDLKPETREAKISEIVTPVFDLPLMARLSLGQKNWARFKPAQQTRFTDLFVLHLKDTYREKLALYTDQQVTVKSAVSKDKKIQVPTEILTEDKAVTVVYLLARLQDRWKIYDVEIEGISIVRTFRSQFEEILTKGSPEDLLRRLEARPQDPNAPKA
ncbi:MAG: ABC transporter substrate-binding protein [Phycisphaerae bacterium]|nr:ABC transporter substrate-binding protein [Phycisphaerae bacterium]